MQGLEISGTVEGCGNSSLENNWVTVKVVNVSFRNDTTFVDNYTKNLEKNLRELGKTRDSAHRPRSNVSLDQLRATSRWDL